MQFSHEIIVPEVGYPFKIFLFEGGSGNYYREKHWHRSVEIFAVCGGELDFYIDDRKCHLESDDFMIVNSNEVHAIASPLPNETIVLPADPAENVCGLFYRRTVYLVYP